MMRAVRTKFVRAALVCFLDYGKGGGVRFVYIFASLSQSLETRFISGKKGERKACLLVKSY